MKKALKIFGIILGLGIIFLIAAPFIFKGTLEKIVKRTINENINATVAWEDLDLSLFRSFPDAALTINNFSIVNNAPFKGDTLASGKTIKLDMGVMQLFNKSDEPIQVNSLFLDEALVNIKVDSLGNANYDIAIKKDAPATSEGETDSAGFSFGLKNYEIENSRIQYSDAVTSTFLTLTNVNHEGSGDLSAALSTLSTKTEALASFKMGDVEYLSENSITLDADFQLDLENQKYTFLENEAKINELPLTFDGFVKINETNNEVDLTFKTPSSDFKNFLAVIPKEYVKELDGVTTTGNFTVNGMIKGIVDDTHIPTLDIKVNSQNASFKYPDLPKAVQNISIAAELKNETGLLKDTYLTIGGLTFKIDDELFNLSGSVRNLTENALVNLALKGTINLANIGKVLPMELEQELTGIFTADVTTNFDMASVEKEQYQNIKSNGTLTLTNFVYKDAAFKNDLNLSKASVSMSPGTIRLNELAATSGQTDIQATGTIENLIPWVMAKQDLKGRFNVQSNTFNVNDFMTSETEASKGTAKASEASLQKESVKIPDFLDATIDFSAKKILYDNIVLENAKGTVGIKNEAASLSNVASKIFGGDIAFSGNVDTKNAVPTFGMNLDLKKIDIGQSFGQLELLKYIAPIAKALDGDLNTTLQLSGELTENLTPNLATLAGNAIAQILTAEVDKDKMPLVSKLGEQVKFLNIDKLSLRDVSTALTFNNGKIEVKPFDFEVKGVKMTVGGSHGLDKSIDYNLTMDVPAKYLGSDVTKLLAKLDPKEADEMTVSLPVGLTGTFTSPQVSLNTDTAVKALTQKLIEKQKEELTTKGTNILKDLITQNSGSTTPTDSTKTTTETTKQEETTKAVKDIIGGIFGNKKKKDDGN
ncbi:AsmA-like C-terminal region-containing protein [Ulvibacter litoralis]|uniref:AsmA-like C-terminal region n=1 Tax=Ulvibacter litoralis TaxID=227084 RepID=A0A1G7J6V8_9FLAO|nr:AsmA-like C-terminal region-containing protein [Ulvibacter litoralis]GHC64180.1 hypothetical protein GCM10008083_31810 [Ulvibacter litoralis]SDF20633.1 AsmA-like C-terminal region [Ulvibacter litoralis]